MIWRRTLKHFPWIFLSVDQYSQDSENTQQQGDEFGKVAQETGF